MNAIAEVNSVWYLHNPRHEQRYKNKISDNKWGLHRAIEI